MEKKTKKKVILINSSLLIFMIIGVVFAWFASNYDNSLDSNDVTVIADSPLQLSVAPEKYDWSNRIQLSDYTWFKKVKFTDITGSGDGNFLRPVLEQNDNYASVVAGEWSVDPTPSSVDNESVNSDYAKFTLYMRSKDKLNVYLGPGSSVEPAAGDKLKGIGTTENQSTYSTDEQPFSKDIVVGAVRLSANTTSAPPERLFTWIPRPDVYCIDASTTRSVTADDITVGSTSDFSTVHKYYDYNSKELTAISGTEGNLVTGAIETTNKKLLATLDGLPNSEGYYTGSVDFYIWIEGCDNEARRAFVDGKFKVNLNITAEDI